MTNETTTAATLDDESRRQLATCSSATLTTQLFKRGLRNQTMQDVHRVTPNAPTLVGEAFTLRNIPAREDIDQINVYEDPNHPQRKAIEIVPRGCVLVVDCRGDARSASAGAILMRRLELRGAAGFVADGGMRDSHGVAARNFPVYCKAPSAPISLIHHHAVDINVPIACGGVAVYPGDVIFGDAEAVVVIPRHLAVEVARDAYAQERLEEFLQSEIAAGRPLAGVYPPNAETRARYEAWRSRKDKS